MLEFTTEQMQALADAGRERFERGLLAELAGSAWTPSAEELRAFLEWGVGLGLAGQRDLKELTRLAGEHGLERLRAPEVTAELERDVLPSERLQRASARLKS